VADALTIFFVIQFLVFIGCFFVKIYNVISLDDPMLIKDSVMVLIVGLFAYGTGLFSILTDFSSFTYLVMFRFESMFLLLFMILFFVELFIFYRSMVYSNEGQRSYNPPRPNT